MAEKIIHLEPGVPVDPRTVLAGSWNSIEIVVVEPHSTHMLERGAVEYCAFVIRGNGVAVIDATHVPLSANTGLVVLRGRQTEIIAGTAGLKALVVAVKA